MYHITRYPLSRTACGPTACATRSPFLSFPEDFFSDSLAEFASLGLQARFPISLEEQKENILIRAELPGVARSDISLETQDGALTIRATRKHGEASTNFARSVSLPEGADVEKASATYENGVLTVAFPKLEKAKPRTIEIR